MPHTVPAASRSSPQRLPEREPHSHDRDRSRSRRRLGGLDGLGRRLQLRSAPRSHRRAQGGAGGAVRFYVTLPRFTVLQIYQNSNFKWFVILYMLEKFFHNQRHKEQEIDKAGSGHRITLENLANWTTLTQRAFWHLLSTKSKGIQHRAENPKSAIQQESDALRHNLNIEAFETFKTGLNPESHATELHLLWD